uniref:Uncharacterized protein n=1 Tax=Anguilla anguilla TaxID=7936 RepID=A0A0E9WLM5_ANGAN
MPMQPSRLHPQCTASEKQGSPAVRCSLALKTNGS